MTNAIETMRETFRDSFMQPQCYRGRDIQDEIMDAGLDCEDDGIYCRLSANGFLDCTDWSGPFASIEEAAQCLIDLYGDE